MLETHFKWTKLIQCNSCKSTIFLDDEGARLIGERSSLSPEPSLIKLHDPIVISKKNYIPLGKIRYSYGRGFWEEWFLKGEDSREYWLSIDEGDFVLEHRVEISLPFKSPHVVKVGREYGEFFVSEIGRGTCVGFEGELPLEIRIGKEHGYIHLSRGAGKLVTVEFTDGIDHVFSGEWIDPLTIKRLYS